MMSPTGGCAAAGGTAAESSKGNRSIATYERCIFKPAHIRLHILKDYDLRKRFVASAASYRGGGLDKWQRQLRSASDMYQNESRSLRLRCCNTNNPTGCKFAKGRQIILLRYLYVIQITSAKSPFNKHRMNLPEGKVCGVVYIE